MSDAQEMGICAIVPNGQKSFVPQVFGMAVLVTDTEVVTCAHVVDEALGLKGQQPTGDLVITVCFPFTDGPICLEGTIDNKRWHPPSAAKGRSDIAVILLRQTAPSSVRRALLSNLTEADDTPLVVYGFRSAELPDGSWVSHPTGEHVEVRFLGPLPDGRGEIAAIADGRAIQKGFSGAGIFDPDHDTIVGMVAEADKNKTAQVANFIEANAIRSVLSPNADLGKSSSHSLSIPRDAMYSLVLAIGVCLFAIYPIGILFVLGFTDDALRWIKHQPSHTLFVLFLLPLAMALFSKAFDYRVIKHIRSRVPIRGALSLLLLLVLAGYMAVAGTSTKKFVEPFYFKDAETRVASDSKVREQLEAGTIPTGINDNEFKDWNDFFTHANSVAYIGIGLNFASNVCALFYVWYFVSLIYTTHSRTIESSGRKVPNEVSWNLSVAFLILISWFPMRIYSEWYASFYHLKHILEYMSFWVFAFMALIIQSAIWLKFDLPVLIRITQIAYSALLLGVSIFSIQSDLILRAVFYILNSLRNIEFLLAYLLVIVSVAILIPLLTPSTARRRTAVRST